MFLKFSKLKPHPINVGIKKAGSVKNINIEIPFALRIKELFSGGKNIKSINKAPNEARPVSVEQKILNPHKIPAKISKTYLSL